MMKKLTLNQRYRSLRQGLIFLCGAFLFTACLEEEEEDEAAPEPTAAFTFSVEGKDVTFTNNSQDADDYAWDFDDGTSSTETDPTKTYDENGVYRVYLTATGAGGSAQLTQNITIDVKPAPEINLPASIFSNSFLKKSDGTFAIRFDEDNSGKFINDRGLIFYYDPAEHVSISTFNGWTIYKISGSRTGFTTRQNFWIHQRGTDYSSLNKVYVSLTGASPSDRYTEYAKVVGKTVAFALATNNISYVKTGSTTWEERNPDGTVNATFTENNRDEWSVYLNKSDGAKLAIDVATFKVKFKSISSSSYRDLYSLKSVTN